MRPTASRPRSPGSSGRSAATCSSSSPTRPRAARGSASRAPAELVDWEPVLDRAGVHVAPHRVAAAYLELAVLVRALEGLSSAVRWESTLDRGSLWAGLFDLRENLLGRALDDLRALAACVAG